MSQPQIQVVITKSEKNPVLGAALAFFFGCIGMLYSTPKGALIMFLPTVISAFLIPLLIGIPMIIVCNIASCVWSYKACEDHNKELVKTVQENHLSKAA